MSTLDSRKAEEKVKDHESNSPEPHRLNKPWNTSSYFIYSVLLSNKSLFLWYFLCLVCEKARLDLHIQVLFKLSQIISNLERTLISSETQRKLSVVTRLLHSLRTEKWKGTYHDKKMLIKITTITFIAIIWIVENDWLQGFTCIRKTPEQGGH